ncbi:MAG: hypothetical protein HQ562_05265 [Candidatus Marinimicrobia bacterium]|nr:hypothetical protein [Candidatus Neomarinimicrobiota bacterium]
MKKIFFLSLCITAVYSQSLVDYLIPARDWSFQFRNGYDSNVLRLSVLEQERAATNLRILGAMSTFDSYFYRIGGSVTANYRLQGRDRALTLNFSPGLTHYVHSPEKHYTTLAFDIDYSWGAYRHLKFRINRLNNFHLREYIDRDVAAATLEICNFSDANHSLIFSFPVARRTWLTFSGGYLQRYYQLPFTEFDLDIYHSAFRFSRTWRHLLSLALEIKTGYANNITLGRTARSSAMDRSYRFFEFYGPLRLRQLLPGLDEIGTALRCEWRYYQVENPDDPLHSGRNHQDLKLDVWIKRTVFEGLTIKLNLRYRVRDTSSDYEWVSDLKSFHQLQTWLDLNWQPDFNWY